MNEKIRAIIADALYVELDEVSSSTGLMKDLGAESIDFLDIVFRLEKEFDIKIPRGEIERQAQGPLSADEFAINGKITEAGLLTLQKSMPEVDADDIQAGLYVRDIPSLFRVATFDRLVAAQLNQRAGTTITETVAVPAL